LTRALFFNLKPAPGGPVWLTQEQPKEVRIMCPLDFEKICPDCPLILIKELIERDPKMTCDILWDEIMHDFDEKINNFCRQRAEARRESKEVITDA
jgi:hypothetical protein